MKGSDVHMSLRKYVATILGTTWTVRAEERRVVTPDDERPFAAVFLPSTIETSLARYTIPQGDVRKEASFSVVLYPELGDTPREARSEAADLQDLLDAAVTFGIVETGPPETFISGPLGVPLYDYSAVPTAGPDRGAVGAPLATATIRSHTSRGIQDEDDDRRWTVVLNLRLAWWTGGRARRLPAPDPVTTAVPGTFGP